MDNNHIELKGGKMKIYLISLLVILSISLVYGATYQTITMSVNDSLTNLPINGVNIIASSIADINFDCVVNDTDLDIVSSHFGETGCNVGNTWCSWADINRDGIVAIADINYIILSAHNCIGYSNSTNADGIASFYVLDKDTLDRYNNYTFNLSHADYIRNYTIFNVTAVQTSMMYMYPLHPSTTPPYKLVFRYKSRNFTVGETNVLHLKVESNQLTVTGDNKLTFAYLISRLWDLIT
jgi:hypothetical protein